MSKLEYTGPETDQLLGEDADGRAFIVQGTALDNRALEMTEDGEYTLPAARAELLNAREWEPGVHTGCYYADGE